MSRINELMADLCPNGVEYKRLGELTTILRGKRLTKNQLSNSGNIPVFHGGLEPLGYYTQSNRSADTVMIINVGASAGTVGFCSKEFWASDGCFCIKHCKQLIPKFLYYFLSSNEKLLTSKVRYAGIPTLDANVIENINVPISPIKIQEEIVQTLDKFTELTAELTAELTKRKKQYQYYKDALFSISDDIEYIPLKDLAINHDAKRRPIAKGKREPGIYPYYGASGIVDYVKNYIFDGNYLLVSEDGANLLARNTPIAFSITGKNWVNNHAHILQFSDINLQKYVEFYINNTDLTKYISAAAQPKLTQENLNNILIPKPPLDRIKHIVAILDRFDALCNDLTSGLPAEIEARQKQYEYYRDKLLTFKEAV